MKAVAMCHVCGVTSSIKQPQSASDVPNVCPLMFAMRASDVW